MGIRVTTSKENFQNYVDFFIQRMPRYAIEYPSGWRMRKGPLTGVNGEKDIVSESIQLTTTRPNFGGKRWWFICPLVVNGISCERRVKKLYLPPGGKYFGCRYCHDLTYKSCRESHFYDSLFAGIAADMQKEFPGFTPKMVRDALRSRGFEV